jgi:hypothetical protein
MDGRRRPLAIEKRSGDLARHVGHAAKVVGVHGAKLGDPEMTQISAQSKINYGDCRKIEPKTVGCLQFHTVGELSFQILLAATQFDA